MRTSRPRMVTSATASTTVISCGIVFFFYFPGTYRDFTAYFMCSDGNVSDGYYDWIDDSCRALRGLNTTSLHTVYIMTVMLLMLMTSILVPADYILNPLREFLLEEYLFYSGMN